MTRLHVACAVQGAYCAHSAAMLHSVAAHSGSSALCVHYLHGPDLPDGSRAKIERMVRRLGGSMAFHEIAPRDVGDLPVVQEFTAAMWYRIFLPELAPDVDRVLYLDVDTIVTDSLQPLWETALEDAYVGAVTNVLMPHHAHRPGTLGLAPDAYFNSGVLLMNLAAMRADGCTEAMRRFASDRQAELEWPDQDTLNVVLGSRRFPLHPRWNAMNSLRFPWSAEVFGADVVHEALSRPAIRHFEGPGANKPWHRDSPRADQRLYRAHRRRTPWPRYRRLGGGHNHEEPSPAIELGDKTAREATNVSARAVAQRGSVFLGRWRWRLSGRRGLEGRMVWIFGSPCSGSTWLLRLLEDHDRTIPVDEPLLGMYLGPFLSDLPGWDADTLDASNFTLRRTQAAKRSQFFAEQFADAWQPPFAEMILQRFRAHAERYPPRSASLSRGLLVIKEPNGSQSADVIMRALPAAKLLFLLRDGRDVVDSELAGNREGAWIMQQFPGARGVTDAQRLDFVRQSAMKWLWRTEVVQEAFAAHPGPRRLLRYEDLLAEPVAQMRALLDWLGLELADPDLHALVERHAFERKPERGEPEFHRSAAPGAWRQNLSAEEQAEVERLLGPKLRELGYSSDAPPAG